MSKVAVVVLAEAETHESLGRLVNGLMTAKELKDHDDEVRLVFDGGGTKGLAEIAPTSSTQTSKTRSPAPATTVPMPSVSRISWSS